MKNGVMAWVIKSRNTTKGIWREDLPTYFARQTGIKNPRYLTNFHWQVKWFNTKDEAERYYFKKLNAGFDLSNCDVKRKKLYLDKKGNYDYFKNRASLMGKRV